MASVPTVFTIPPHRGFADALAAGLLVRAGRDPLALARGLVLLPNGGAVEAIRDAFVRRAGAGLLLPRLVSIGDPALDERLGAALDPIGEDGAPPPAIDPVRRQLILARLIEEARAAAGQPIDAGEALRLAADLGRTLDQLIVEEVDTARLQEAVPAELAEHWQASLQALEVVLSRWPAELARTGRIDLAARRNRLLDAAARRWGERPPAGMVVAAGISAAGPAVGRLLHRIAWLERGMVVLAGLDRAMPDEEWDALDPAEGPRIETHPQFASRRLLDRIGVARGEVGSWRWGGGGVRSARSRAISNAMAPARFTDRWRDLPTDHRRLSGIRAAEHATPAAEAQAIALALREVVETPGRTAALVTPDRGLAARVSAHLARWGIEADDGAGRPLSLLPPGTLLLALAEVIAQDFAPVPLLALLKHPLVRGGGERRAWLDGARLLDRALRGPRPEPGLDGVTRFLVETDRQKPLGWWREVLPLLAPLIEGPATLGAMLARLREGAERLAGDEAWARPAGRAAAELVAALEAGAGEGPRLLDAAGLPALLRAMLDGVAVRPPQGGHPRVAIHGLIEARLRRADLMVLGGLNEGVWPGLPAPDPWLAPAIRASLGLPGLEARIGAEAQEFAAALGAPQVLLSRARRDARAPAVASRFWLRLEAMSGGLPRMPSLARWTEAIDRPSAYRPATRPAPRPPIADRPRKIAVTKLDRLKADPFAFYADAMLRLRRWDAVDADPSAAWRGSAVHRVLEAWAKLDDGDPARLRARVEALLAGASAHPVLRALWAPRLLEAIDWIAAQMAEDRAAGRRLLAAELKGSVPFGAVELHGTADRIDRTAGGMLAIVDYKTGKPPSRAAVAEGYAMQLGLLGLIAERGGFAGVTGVPDTFEYWSLAAGRTGTLGYRDRPTGLDKQERGIAAEDFTSHAARVLDGAIALWFTGDAPFTAKLHPEHAPYGDYDQLMRLDEWYGRADRVGPAA